MCGAWLRSWRTLRFAFSSFQLFIVSPFCLFNFLSCWLFVFSTFLLFNFFTSLLLFYFFLSFLIEKYPCFCRTGLNALAEIYSRTDTEVSTSPLGVWLWPSKGQERVKKRNSERIWRCVSKVPISGSIRMTWGCEGQQNLIGASAPSCFNPFPILRRW